MYRIGADVAGPVTPGPVAAAVSVALTPLDAVPVDLLLRRPVVLDGERANGQHQ